MTAWKFEVRDDDDGGEVRLILSGPQGEAACFNVLSTSLRAKVLRLFRDAPKFQDAVFEWARKCFGLVIAHDLMERKHRFLEEALELGQSFGVTRSEALQLVDYVYGRPTGAPEQEVGGTMVTLAALCSAASIDMEEAARAELKRCWQNIERIRAKQLIKPKFGPPPGADGK